MKNKSYHKIDKFNLSSCLYVTFISLFIYPSLLIAKETKNHLLPINYKTISNKSKIILKQMPVGNIDAASKKVKNLRDPFQEPAYSEINNLDDFSYAIEFKGIAKSKDNLVAVIKTRDKQKSYKVGDYLDNGFRIKNISIKDIAVDIVNGTKSYRLTFKKLSI